MQTSRFHPGMTTRVRSLDEDIGVCVHASDWGFRKPENRSSDDYLMHHGIKGQKWGVITKEYEPVAVDHRKIGHRGLVAKFRQKRQEENAKWEKEEAELRAARQNSIQQRNELLRKGGITIGVGTLALSLYAGYKLNHIHSGGGMLKNLLGTIRTDGLTKGQKLKNVLGIVGAGGAKAGKNLKSVLNIIPNKADLKTLGRAGMNALMAKNQTSTSGLAKVKDTFSKAGSMLKMRSYRDKIKRARNMIQKYGSMSL